MMMLCQILQTEDVDAVQKWLGDAGENGGCKKKYEDILYVLDYIPNLN